MGIRSTRPGPLSPITRPSRKTTARLYSGTILIARARVMRSRTTTTTTTTSTAVIVREPSLSDLRFLGSRFGLHLERQPCHARNPHGGTGGHRTGGGASGPRLAAHTDHAHGVEGPEHRALGTDDRVRATTHRRVPGVDDGAQHEEEEEGVADGNAEDQRQ